MSRKSPARRRGAALILVLWLTAALALIGFSVAATIREETARTGDSIEMARAEFLARGAIERTLWYLKAPPYDPDRPPVFEPGQQRVYYRFPGGDVLVELLPESGKLNVNSAKLDQALAVLLRAGVPPEPAQRFVGSLSTFRAANASIVRNEDFFLLPGVSPNLYYGSLDRLPGAGLRVRPGLRDLLSPFGATETFDANSAPAAVMEVAGVPAPLVAQIVAFRARAQIRYVDLERLGLEKILRAGPDVAYTMKATARPRRADGELSDFRRTLSALIVYRPAFGGGNEPKLERWDESATSEVPWP